jgi:hypothetical protein
VIGAAPACGLQGGLRFLDGKLGFRQRRSDFRNAGALSGCVEPVGKAIRFHWGDLATKQRGVNACSRGDDGRSRAN